MMPSSLLYLLNCDDFVKYFPPVVLHLYLVPKAPECSLHWFAKQNENLRARATILAENLFTVSKVNL